MERKLLFKRLLAPIFYHFRPLLAACFGRVLLPVVPFAFLLFFAFAGAKILPKSFPRGLQDALGTHVAIQAVFFADGLSCSASASIIFQTRVACRRSFCVPGFLRFRWGRITLLPLGSLLFQPISKLLKFVDGCFSSAPQPT